MKSVITNVRRKKMAEATYSTGRLARAKWIALGSGGVNEEGEVIMPLGESMTLAHEEIRKEISSSKKVTETSYEYTIDLSETELVCKQISELALIDEDGDVIAFSNFLAKGKDEVEVSFSIEDSY